MTTSPAPAPPHDVHADPPPVFESETGAPVPNPEPEPHTHVGAGLAYAGGAYLWWGIIPIYFKAIAHISPLTILAHRIFWCALFLVPLLLMRGQWSDVLRLARSRKARIALICSTLLIACNWGVFIYAVAAERLAEASLGYFINPLISVLLGFVFLGERLRPAQIAAVALAVGGVAYLTWSSGSLPWISVVLALTFGVYGLVRKRSPAGPMVGLFFETSLLAPLAGGFLLYGALTPGPDSFGIPLPPPFFEGMHETLTSVMLPLGGLITAVPLLWFAAATRRLRLSTVGFIQYLAPTLQFLLAVVFFGETFDESRWVAFGLIWAAVVVFVSDSAVRISGDRRRAASRLGPPPQTRR